MSIAGMSIPFDLTAVSTAMSSVLGGVASLLRRSAGPPLLQATETREQLDWLHLPEVWVVFLVIVPLVVLASVLAYRRERIAGREWMRWVLAALRAVVVLAILAFLAQPVLRRVTVQTRDPRLVVLVDDSLSMGISDRYSDRSIPRRLGELLGASPELVEQLTRYGIVDRVLRSGKASGGESGASLLDRLLEKMSVSIYTFAGSARKIAEIPRRGSAAAAAAADPDAGFGGLPDLERVQGDERVKETRIGDSVLEALLDLREDGGASLDHGIAGVVLFTDGQNNAGVLQPEEMATRLAQRGVRLIVVGVGNPDPPKNIRVVNIDVDDVVLVGDEVEFDASILSEGFDGESIQVDLAFGGDVVDTRYLTLEGGRKPQNVRLVYKPEHPGEFTVSVEAEKRAGELFVDDNIASRTIQVLDEKIKVLYVEGPPRWEYRYLKNALIRDPTMETQVLLLSADREFRQESSPGIPPLVQFPGKRDELFAYHVIVIGDVDPRLTDPAGVPFSAHLDLIREFVGESGGGVVFIAGPQADPQRYIDTPLYALLPVEVSEPGPGLRDRPITESFNVELTGAGKEHPAMRLDNDFDRNVQLWENTDGVDENHLPAFDWFAEVDKVKLGGIALAVHPRLSHPIHGRRVIFAFQNYNKGKAFFSGVDNTWRWRAGVDNLYFYRFWGQVIRFAASGRLLGKTPRFSIATDKGVYTIGETVAIDARVHDANMEPSTAPTVTAYHAIRGRLDEPEKIELQLNPAREAGVYEGSIVVGRLGSHDLWLGTESERVAFVTIGVEVPPLEFRDPRLDAARLEKVARLAGGKYYELHEFAKAVDVLRGSARPRQIPIEERQDDLWDEYWALLAFTGVLALEWILRKAVKLL